MRVKSLSVILPAYNEEGNIVNTIKNVYKYLPKVSDDYEVIVVNDGSHDSTPALVQNTQKQFPMLKLINQPNKGYGGALKTGFQNSTKEWIFYMDSDGQFDFQDIYKLIPYSADYDFIFGYRLERADNSFRKFLGNALKVWGKVIFGIPYNIIDIDCGFKLLHSSAFRTILPIKADGAMISTEIFLKLIKLDNKIKQVGVSHYPRKYGKSTGSDILVVVFAIKETLILSFYSLLGRLKRQRNRSR